MMMKTELVLLSLLAGLLVGGISGFAIAKREQSDLKPVEVSDLCRELRERGGGMTVLMAGVDTMRTLRQLCDAVETLERRHVKATCVEYTLVINQAIGPDEAAAIARELQDVVPKIAEACEKVKGWRR
jgi:hypothetical protein